MVDRFIALPVGQGDAFFYQRDDRTILIDGGGSEKNCPKLVDKHLNIEKIDIIVCTHNDADHTNGLIGLLNPEQKKIKIDEVWLPGSWSYKLKELLENPNRFFIELAEDIAKIPDEKSSTLENLTIFTKNLFQEVDQYKEINNELFLNLFNHKKNTYTKFSDLRKILKPNLWLLQQQMHLWTSAIKAADRITKIATLAYSRRVKIRWFDFNEFKSKDHPSGGETGVLEPVNACEILPRIANIGTLQYLYLTVENKQSLVFLGLEKKNKPGVLFNADSDLDFDFQYPSPTLSMIATTPHHGSENNQNAYRKIDAWHKNSSSVIWVRSDGMYKFRPGKSFLSVSGQKLCTICRPPSNQTKQAVKLSHSQSCLVKWVGDSNVRTCQCK